MMNNALFFSGEFSAAFGALSGLIGVYFGMEGAGVILHCLMLFVFRYGSFNGLFIKNHPALWAFARMIPHHRRMHRAGIIERVRSLYRP